MKHYPALDGLRAIAVLMVVGFHAQVPRASGGYLGVDVFFVLSGFLITSLLEAQVARAGSIALLAFYRRRLLRLGPALIFMLAFYLLLAPLIWPDMPRWQHNRDALIAATYLSDYTSSFWGMPLHLRHTWSLAVEEHFYLVWPFVLLALYRLPKPAQRVSVLLGLYALATFWRIYCDLDDGTTGYGRTYYRFDTRLSGLVLGALLASALNWQSRFKPTQEDFFAPFALLVLGLCTWRFSVGSTLAVTYGMTLVEWATVVLIVVAVRGSSWVTQGLLTHPLLTFCGRISYGIYLWHYPILNAMWDELPWYETLAIGMPLTLAAATLSYYTIERVFRELPRRATINSA